MTKTRCAYGFSCSSMLMSPGLKAEDCPNRNTCGTIRVLSPEEVAEMQIAKIENNRRIIERIKVTAPTAARMLLDRRGLPQNAKSLGIAESVAFLKAKIAEIEARVEEATAKYVAPHGVEAHRYSVKRPSTIYQYNKLASRKAIFPPSEKDENVKVIHLSSDNDARNVLGRLGIERRNQLLALKTQIDNATDTLNVYLECISEKAALQKLAEKRVK